VVPAWFDWMKGRLDYFEPVHAIGAVYFVYFGLGSIWSVGGAGRVAYDIHLVSYIPQAAAYSLFGYLAFLTGYYAFFRARKAPRAVQENLRGNLFLFVVGGMGLVGLLCLGLLESAVKQGRGVGLVVGTLSQLWPIFLFSWALAWYLLFSRQTTRGQKWIVLAFILPGGLLAAYSTFSDKSLALTLVVVPMVSRWYARRKMPWTFLIVTLLVLIFVIFPLYNTFRWFDGGMSKGERVGMAVQTIQTWDQENFLRFSIHTFTARMAMVNSLAVVIRESPRWVPRMYGKTIFMPTVAYFIPRIVWPDKPTMNFGKDFAREFRVTNTLNKEVLVGSTIPGELYWNFGFPGIVVGMALFGAFVRFLYRRYAEGVHSSPLLVATHVALLVQWVHIVGGSVAAGFVAVVRLLIMLEVLRWMGRYYGLLEVVERR
jgi:hypothetical protein